MKRFEDRMKEMSDDYEKSKEIILRYDEIITEKASKTSIQEIYLFLEGFLKVNTF